MNAVLNFFVIGETELGFVPFGDFPTSDPDYFVPFDDPRIYPFSDLFFGCCGRSEDEKLRRKEIFEELRANFTAPSQREGAPPSLAYRSNKGTHNPWELLIVFADYRFRGMCQYVFSENGYFDPNAI